MNLEHLKKVTGLSDAAIGARVGWSQSAIHCVRVGKRVQNDRLSRALELAFKDEIDSAEFSDASMEDAV
jgi:hypothetical protein